MHVSGGSDSASGEDHGGAALSEVVVQQQLRNHTGYLVAARDRRLDSIGVVVMVATDQTQIQNRERAADCLQKDAVIENRQSGDGETLHGRFGKSRVIDRTDRSGQSTCEDALEHRTIVGLKSLADRGQTVERRRYGIGPV